MSAPPAVHSWRESLPAHPDEHRTGAVWLEYDPRDYRALWLPEIATLTRLATGGDISLAALVKEPRLNQGSEGSCVAASSEGTCQLAHSALDGSWPPYSIHELYAEAGGHGSDGVDVRTVMKICIEKGTPLASGARDNVIKSYLFVDRTPSVFEEQVTAALTAGHPVLVASLLPIPFGWNTGMALSSGYHQYVGIGVMTDPSGKRWLIIQNSWGDSWPGDAPSGTPPGVGRISFEALEQENMQNGYTYGVIPTMSLVMPPPPPPPPPPPIRTATVTGQATGTGITQLARDQVYTLGTGISLQLTDVKLDQNPPPPPPPPGLSVTGYSPNPVKGGDNFYIQGQGFQGGNLSVLWQERLLSANRLSDAQIQATAPSVTTTATGAVTVRVEGATADGPALTVSADEGPPPGDLKVTVTARRYSRGLVGIWAYVQAPGSGALDIVMPPNDDIILPPTVLNPEVGGYVAATVQGTVGMMALAARQTTTGGTPAVWQLSQVPAMATITITAVDDQGRRGQGTAGV